MSARRQVALYWGGVTLTGLALAPLAGRLAVLSSGCAFKSLTGLPCLSCGATRAVLGLAQGSPWTAFAANPLVTLALVLFGIGGLTAFAMALLDLPLPGLPRRLPMSLRLGAVAVLAANWIYLIEAGV